MTQKKIKGDQLDLSLADGSLLTGVNADELQGNNGAFYQDAGNLNAGTLAAARLSGTYNINISGNAVTADDSDALGGVAAASWAKLASPIFTGNPRAPTPSPADNDTTIATTAYVTNAVGGSSGYVSSTAIAYTGASQQFSWTHNLGHRLNSLLVEMRCTVADGTWDVGDSVIVSTADQAYSDSGGNCCGNVRGVFPWVDSGTATSRVFVRVGNIGLQLIKQTSGNVFVASAGRWNFYLYAA